MQDNMEEEMVGNIMNVKEQLKDGIETADIFIDYVFDEEYVAIPKTSAIALLSLVEVAEGIERGDNFMGEQWQKYNKFDSAVKAVTQ